MRKLYLALSFLAFTVISPFGQEVHFPIFNSTITFNQLPPSPPPISRSINTDNYWVAFSTYIQNNLYLQLQSMNVDIKCYGKYQGGYIYHLNIGSNFDDVITKLLEDLTFVNIIPVEPADKIEEPIWTRTDLVYHDVVKQTIRAVVDFNHPLSQVPWICETKKE